MPNIVYLHGFASGAQSKKGCYLRDKFAEIGAQVFQPELVEGDFRETTVSSQLEVVDRAVHEHKPSLLIGSSLGGYLAALYASGQSDQVPALVLLAPAFDFVRRWAKRLGTEQMDAWKKSGEMAVYHYGRNEPTSIGYSFFEDALRHDPFPAAPQPTIIFHGHHDVVVDPEISVHYAREKAHVELVPMDSDHQLLDVLDAIWGGIERFHAQLEPFRDVRAYSDTKV